MADLSSALKELQKRLQGGTISSSQAAQAFTTPTTTTTPTLSSALQELQNRVSSGTITPTQASQAFTTPTTTKTPTTTPTTSSLLPSASTETSYTDFIQSQLENQNKMLQTIMNLQSNKPTYEDLLTKYSEQLGITAKEEEQAGLTEQVTAVEDMLDKLESDINQRTTGRFYLNEAARRRELATEGKPLREQLTDLMSAQATSSEGLTSLREQLANLIAGEQTDYANQIAAAQLPLTYSSEMLPLYKELLTYQEPTTTYETPKTIESGGKVYQWNTTTGAWEDTGLAAETTTDYSSIKSVNGGLFDVKNGSWLVQPTEDTKPATQAQYTQAGFGQRLNTSNDQVENLTEQIKNINPVLYQIEMEKPVWLRDDWAKQYQQAMDNFINAKLRQESGAAIADSEYDKAERQYFPIAGDSDEVIDQKAENRKQVIEQFKKAAGPAWDELVGTEESKKVVSQIIYKGKTYNVDANGDMTLAE